jgi:hypothetical protein
MNVLMLRWKMVSLYVPAAQWARKFSAARGVVSQNTSIWGSAIGEFLPERRRAGQLVLLTLSIAGPGDIEVTYLEIA